MHKDEKVTLVIKIVGKLCTDTAPPSTTGLEGQTQAVDLRALIWTLNFGDPGSGKVLTRIGGEITSRVTNYPCSL